MWAFRYSSEGKSRSLYYTTDVPTPTLRRLYPERQLCQEVSDEAPPGSERLEAAGPGTPVPNGAGKGRRCLRDPRGILDAVNAIQRATDSIERHVEVIEGLATSVGPLTDSVDRLTATKGDLVSLLAPMGAAEHEVQRVEGFLRTPPPRKQDRALAGPRVRDAPPRRPRR